MKTSHKSDELKKKKIKKSGTYVKNMTLHILFEFSAHQTCITFLKWFPCLVHIPIGISLDSPYTPLITIESLMILITILSTFILIDKRRKCQLMSVKSSESV